MAGPDKSKMAIKSQPKDLAKKLAKTDISGYALGTDAKAGIKKFGDKHPVLVYDYEGKNDEIFSASDITKEKTTRRADYAAGEDEKAYESYSPTMRNIIEKAVKKYSENAQKGGAIKGHDSVKAQHISAEVEGTAGDNTHEPAKKILAKLPPQVVTSEEVLNELGEPMSPAPATADNPGAGGGATADSSQDATNQQSQDDGDDEDGQGDGSAEKAKDFLENIAMQAAELFEKISDDAELPDWALEKLQLAQTFVASVTQHLDDGEGGDDEDEAGAESPPTGQAQKPSAFKGGDTALAKG